jgi:hypothetical protein
VLDSGVEPLDEGVGYVEFLIDRALWFSDKIDCRFDASAGGKTNCYGLRREDVAMRYPVLKDSIHSGFRFAIDVGALVGSGLYTPGDHYIGVRAGDISGQRSLVDEMKVTFNCIEETGNVPSFGFIENPNPGFSYHGTIPVTGWALDNDGVGVVYVYVDGFLQPGTATYGLLRPDIAAANPGYVDNPNSGFTYNLDTTVLANGKHNVEVYVADKLSQFTLIGERLIWVGNP